MTCFCLTVTYIHITLEVRTHSVYPTAGLKARKFSLCFQGPKIFNSLSSEIQNVSSISLVTSKLKSLFSWYNHTSLFLLTLVCSFSLRSLSSLVYTWIIFSYFLLFVLKLHVQPYLFLSYLMIIFFVVKKLYMLS